MAPSASAHMIGRCLLVWLCAYSAPLPAAEWTVGGVVGAGNHVTTAGVEAQAPSGLDGELTDKWSWSLHWAGNIGYWWARNHAASNPSLWEVGLTPVIGLRHAASSIVSGYIEAGVGVHLLSHTRIDERVLSTAFQFGEFLGAGVNCGERKQYGIGVRIQHLSNGRIKEPNDGITFGEIRIAYRWD